MKITLLFLLFLGCCLTCTAQRTIVIWGIQICNASSATATLSYSMFGLFNGNAFLAASGTVVLLPGCSTPVFAEFTGDTPATFPGPSAVTGCVQTGSWSFQYGSGVVCTNFDVSYGGTAYKVVAIKPVVASVRLSGGGHTNRIVAWYRKVFYKKGP